MDGEDSSDHLHLVSSLYGPGTIGAWLLAVLSLMLSWSLDRQSSHGEAITVDFAAVLLMPFVAATHLIRQLIDLPRTTANATPDQIAAHLSAMDAPLAVCHDFMAYVSLLCGLIAPKLRRSSWAWSQRLAWLLLAYYYCLIVVSSAHVAVGDGIRDWPSSRQHILTVVESLTLVSSVMSLALGLSISYTRRTGRVSMKMRCMFAAAVFCFLGLGLATFVELFRIGVIPRSGTRLGELDQVISLVGGFIALGGSIRGILRNRSSSRPEASVTS